MASKDFRRALVVVSGSVCLVLAFAGVVGYRAWKYPDRPRAGPGGEVQVEIVRGMTFPRIANLLASKQLIDSPRLFRYYAMYRGATTKVKSGTYTLKDDRTPRQILDRLTKGVRALTARVTIREGLNMVEAIELIAREGIADAGALEKIARDPKFASEQGIPGTSVEGYLFPETYRFRVPTPPKTVLTRLIQHHRDVWKRVLARNQQGFARLQQTLQWGEREVIVLASIVEKEAARTEELPRIAQVFINRLVSPKFQPKRLETDPTIRYGCMIPLHKSAACQSWDPTRRLRRAQLVDNHNPYNTYRREGLPPGPICSPGEAAMEAVLRPDGSDYYYFVSRNNGTHVFSKTLREHTRAVDKFQR